MLETGVAHEKSFASFFFLIDCFVLLNVQHILRVPLLKEDLLWDDPLPSSTAVPFNPKKAAPINIIQRKWGQRLTGDMIPIRYVQ